jgi:hypothetical protein
MKRRCSWNKVQDYKGVRRPQCLGGKGCLECWKKYIDRQIRLLDLERVMG